MPTNTRKATTKDLAKPYEPTARERAALEAYLVRKKEYPPTPRMKIIESDGVNKVSVIPSPHSTSARNRSWS